MVPHYGIIIAIFQVRKYYFLRRRKEREEVLESVVLNSINL